MTKFSLGRLSLGFFATLMLMLGGSVFADAKGDAIAKKNFDLKKSVDSTSTATMVLIDKAGNKKVRKLEMFSKEGAEGRNSFTNFLEPADVAGTRFLTLAHKGAESEQRLYLPALKKARKIASGGKDGDFVNSDFNYYDLDVREFGDFSYTFLAENETIADKAYEGMKFFKIEMKPKAADAPYSKSVVWINADNYVAYKMDLYDKKDNGLLKTLQVVKVENIQGILVQTQIVMSNVRKGTKTLFQLDGVKINSGLKDEIFTVKNLEK